MFDKWFAIRVFVNLVILLLFCEFLIYYIVLIQCSWPLSVAAPKGEVPVKAVLLADTHMLGPRRGHWWDKLRREWQMHRAFQTTMTLFHPKAVFILGDVFDEGNWVDDTEFTVYIRRFHKLFHTPQDTKLFVLAGNHDIGFHYSIHPYLLERFDQSFNASLVSLVSMNDVHFVLINSMAMEGDKCDLCKVAQSELTEIARTLDCAESGKECKVSPKLNQFSGKRYSRPIVLQHFPMYRQSDTECRVGDAPDIEFYRENWEVLSLESTDLIGKMLRPRLAVSGHSHNYCELVSPRLGIPEYTLASFSWRNKDNPSFLLAEISSSDFKIVKCDMPRESTVILIYKICIPLAIVIAILRTRFRSKYKKIK